MRFSNRHCFERAARRVGSQRRRGSRRGRNSIAALEAGGFVEAHWDGTSETEELIKKETKATIRCIPLEGQGRAGCKCVRTGAASAKQRVVFARAY